MTGVAARPAATLRLAAPAKINLYLHVVGRRGDGYHLLDSLVAFAAIGDELSMIPAPTLALTIGGPFGAGLEADEGNLILRAARAVAAATGHAAGAAIHLVKNLPVASGIGGGSADAAATLRGLNCLWDVGLSDSRLADIGMTLGADVPVCLAGGPSYVGGTGERILPAPGLPPTALVLINPGCPLPTVAVFRARAAGPAAERYSPPARLSVAVPNAAALAALLADRANDLTDAAIGLMPEIADVLALLGRQPGCLLARLSGSGATCFGLFAEHETASRAAAAIAAEQPLWWVAPTSLLESGGYANADSHS